MGGGGGGGRKTTEAKMNKYYKDCLCGICRHCKCFNKNIISLKKDFIKKHFIKSEVTKRCK